MKQIAIAVRKNFRRREFAINAHENEYISRILERTGTFYEIDILEFCKSLEPRCRYVFDVGANIGNHSVYWAAVCDAKVQAFEPYFENFKLLEKNIVGNGLSDKVVAHRVALGAKPGLARLKVLEPGNMGMVAVQSQEDTYAKPDIMTTAEVKTLDQCVLELMPRYIDLLKIDTEGYEANVILGGLGVLKEYQPLIWVEIWSEESFLHIRDILEKVGYVWSARYRSSHNYFFSKVPRPLLLAKFKRRAKSTIINRLFSLRSIALSKR
ncbi:MAG: FkbM family methyltransferase [Haliea sp.]|nr:FkbM family methyltransferase [Haliea sp.]